MVNGDKVRNMNTVTRIRQITVLILLITGAIVLITGIFLELFPEGPGSGRITLLGLSKHSISNLHTYAGFAMAGTLIVHLAANIHALSYYLKRIIK